MSASVIEPGPAPVRRGCGYRIVAGVYLETKVTGVFLRGAGKEPELFDRCLYDPPIVVDLARIGLTEVGVQLVDAPGPDGSTVTHVFDVVGAKYYPDVLGFVAEARAHGVSRRVPTSLDFSRLTERSRIVLVHSRAWIDNADEYFAARAAGVWGCPKDRDDHLSPECPPAMCASLHAEDLGDSGDDGDRVAIRRVGDTTYRGLTRPPGVVGRYRHAIFASFPLTGLAVIRDPSSGSHTRALERARRARIPVTIEDA